VPYFPILHFHVSHFQPPPSTDFNALPFRHKRAEQRAPRTTGIKTKALYDKTHLVYLVANMVMLCGRYGLWPLCLWPIWYRADWLSHSMLKLHIEYYLYNVSHRLCHSSIVNCCPLVSLQYLSGLSVLPTDKDIWWDIFRWFLLSVCVHRINSQHFASDLVHFKTVSK